MSLSAKHGYPNCHKSKSWKLYGARESVCIRQGALKVRNNWYPEIWPWTGISGTHFNMSIHWAYVHILQPQLCVGKSMAVQVIHLSRISIRNIIIHHFLDGKYYALSTKRIIRTPIKRSLISILIIRSCRETADPPTVSSPTLLTDSLSNARVASKVGSQSDCCSQCLKEKLPWYCK